MANAPRPKRENEFDLFRTHLGLQIANVQPQAPTARLSRVLYRKHSARIHARSQIHLQPVLLPGEDPSRHIAALDVVIDLVNAKHAPRPVEVGEVTRQKSDSTYRPGNTLMQVLIKQKRPRA